jgi:methyl-accepting chemotaxis protein
MQVLAKYGNQSDELGQTIAATDVFLKRINEVSKALETVADGDLTASFSPLSAEDTLGLSLQKMTENLNAMFGDINNSTNQVASGSKQIADGAQALAQGSTQQAAAVEQLSSSIGEIAEKTKENAAMADKAATLSESIRHNAEKGSNQMGQMTQAVKEINDASQAISKVIKTIDDIAFQTNILALNAAVEAARAGQHGKGFAVVAEEVRSLASKSAAAAKDTAELIENSMEKAGLGAKIAGETAASLGEIVSGINESSALVSDIAKSSEEQSLGIAQINKGIDQVAQVVQQKSATAEESAAAAEEMSSQSNMLEELIQQFKFKDSDARRPQLGSAPTAKALPLNGYGKY